MPNYFLSGMGQLRLEFLEDRIGKGEELSPTLIEEYNLLSDVQFSSPGLFLHGRLLRSRISEPIRRLIDRGYLSTTSAKPRPTSKGRRGYWWLRD